MPEAASKQRAFAGGSGHGAGEEADLDCTFGEAAQQPVRGQHGVPGQCAQGPADGFEVLGREDLGGRQECGLPAGVHHLQHGAERHQGLAGANFALQEPVHGGVLREFGCKGFSHSRLSGSQRERQVPVEGRQQPIGGRAPGSGFFGRKLGTAPCQCRLQHERFLVAKTVLGALPVGLRFGPVDEPVGLRDRQELFPAGHGLGQRIGQRLQIDRLEQRVDHFLDRPAGQLGRGRVHRDGHGSQLFGVHTGHVRVLVQEVEVRVGQAQGGAVPGHLAGEHHAPAGQEFGLCPVAAEEGDLERAVPAARAHGGKPGTAMGCGVVGNDDVGNGAAARVHLAGAVGQDPRNEGDFLVHGQLIDGRQLAPVQVAAGEVVQQPADGADLQVFLNGRG